MRHYITTIMTLLLLAACQGKEAAVMEDSKEIFIPLSTRVELTVEDLFLEYRYIPLETCSEALLPDQNHLKALYVRNGRIYVAANDLVYVFDQNGKHLFTLSHKGEGPEEYIGLYHCLVWDNGDISVLAGHSMVNYTSEGAFISRHDFPDLFCRAAIALNDSLYLMRHFEFSKPEFDRFYVMNRYTGEPVRSYWHMKRRGFVFWFTDAFCTYQDKILFNEYQNNGIYELAADSASLRYVINVNDRMAPPGFWEQEGLSGMPLRKEWEKQGYICHIPYFVESASTILLRFEGPDEYQQAYACIDKRTHQSKLIKTIRYDDYFRNEPRALFPQGDGWCGILLNAEEVVQKEAFAARFTGLNEESNPVLFIGKLK